MAKALTKAQKADRLAELAAETGDDPFTVATKYPELAGGLETLAKRRATPSQPAKSPRRKAPAKPAVATSRGSGTFLEDGALGHDFQADYRR